MLSQNASAGGRHCLGYNGLEIDVEFFVVGILDDYTDSSISSGDSDCFAKTGLEVKKVLAQPGRVVSG